MTGQDYRALRIGQGWTQLKLAILLEVYPSTITRREAADSITTEQELAIRRLIREAEAAEGLAPAEAGGV